MATLTKERMLVMENGSAHRGTGFGAMNDAVCELVFNTSMVGYQEIVTDPSYTAQTVVMTYPLIGNYGITDEDNETRVPTMGGLVVREYCDIPSNFRYTKTLSEILEENGIPGLQGVDTRMIGRMIRGEGSQRALICDADTPLEEAMERIRAYELPTDCVSRVSCKKKWYARTPNPRYSVVAVDCALTKEQANRLADVAHDGLARAIRPVHTQMDGDTMFALATGRVGSDVNFVKLCAAAAEVTARAIANAILFSLDA